jgi:predicted N-formylglutamate amidohydrolase
VLVTAEHGGYRVPPEYADLFRGRDELLRSHRGWDPGTYELAQALGRALRARTIRARVTRLLVDLNRSAHNPKVFSEITRRLPRAERVKLLARHHLPHWKRARDAVSTGIAEQGRVLHLGVHSFTPVLDGVVRNPDLALLYDPARPGELELATRWSRSLSEALPDRVIRRNNPYRGAADGMTTAFRRSFSAARYVGIEVEVNQRHLSADGVLPAWIAEALVGTLRNVLAG